MLDLIFNAMVLLVGLHELENLSSVERLKKDLKVIVILSVESVRPSCHECFIDNMYIAQEAIWHIDRA